MLSASGSDGDGDDDEEEEEEEEEEKERRALVVVSHDREFVDSVCEETIILRDKTLQPFKGNPSAYEADLRS